MKNLKLNCLALAGLTAIMGGLCACDGGNHSSSITTVNIVLFNGTGGKEWVTNATKRFAEANKETSFEEGKKGINFKITQKKNVIFNTELKSSGDDIFIYESTVDPYQLSAQNFLLDLSDVVAPIEDKIEDNIKERCKGVDGKYYALPHYEWFPGLSYDKDLFNEKNFYFADPSVDAEDKDLYQSKYGDAYFIADKTIKKSVGPNGIRGDYDDGLPSSLQEFNILCSKMFGDGVSPILLPGSGHYYSWYFPVELWASLTGGNGMKDAFCNWTEEEVEVVNSFSNEDVFYSGSGLKKPVTAKMKLTDDNGYQAYNMANRYYSLAFFDMALQNEWIDKEALANSNQTPTEAMNWFINKHNNKSYGMYWDGSYWCHEAADVGTFDTYSKMNPSNPDRHVSFMPLPTTLTGQVQEGAGKKPTLLNVGTTLAFANARVKKNGKEKAVKEFLKFIYSNDELAAFSEKTGLTVPCEYTYDISKLKNSYYEDLATYRKDAEVVQPSSYSTRFKKNMPTFLIGYTMTISSFASENGTQNVGGYLDAFRKLGCTSEYIFEHTQISKDSWEKMAK